jgi:hypothetical protein
MMFIAVPLALFGRTLEKLDSTPGHNLLKPPYGIGLIGANDGGGI